MAQEIELLVSFETKVMSHLMNKTLLPKSANCFL